MKESFFNYKQFLKDISSIISYSEFWFVMGAVCGLIGTIFSLISLIMAGSQPVLFFLGALFVLVSWACILIGRDMDKVTSRYNKDKPKYFPWVIDIARRYGRCNFMKDQ